MPLHDKHSVRDEVEDELYSSADFSVSMPKYRFPKIEQNPRHAYEVGHDELMLDGNSRQNLATFCQTWAKPEVHQLMDECMDKNMIDKDEYPQTAEIEGNCAICSATYGTPGGCQYSRLFHDRLQRGRHVGGIAMKRNWEAKRKAAGKPIDRPNLVTGPVQICWHKFTRY